MRGRCALAAWREQAGLTQAEVAARLGVSTRTIRRLERRTLAHLRVRDLEGYAAAVGVPVVVLCPSFLVAPQGHQAPTP